MHLFNVMNKGGHLLRWTTFIPPSLLFFPPQWTFCLSTLSWAFSVVRGVSWQISSEDRSGGRSHTFTVQSWLPVATKEAFILWTNSRVINAHRNSDALQSIQSSPGPNINQMKAKIRRQGIWRATWSSWWILQHWCGWCPGPHSTPDRCRCPSATHAPTCPEDEHKYVHVKTLDYFDFWGGGGFRGARPKIVYLCTACKEKAFFENIQGEDSICERQ